MGNLAQPSEITARDFYGVDSFGGFVSFHSFVLCLKDRPSCGGGSFKATGSLGPIARPLPPPLPLNLLRTDVPFI